MLVRSTSTLIASTQVGNIGFTISPEEIHNEIASYVASSTINGWSDLGSTLGALRGRPSLRWANQLEVKTTLESIFTSKFGSKELSKPAKTPKVRSSSTSHI